MQAPQAVPTPRVAKRCDAMRYKTRSTAGALDRICQRPGQAILAGSSIISYATLHLAPVRPSSRHLHMTIHHGETDRPKGRRRDSDDSGYAGCDESGRTHAHSCSGILLLYYRHSSTTAYKVCVQYLYSLLLQPHRVCMLTNSVFKFFKRSIGSVTASSIRFAYARHAFGTLAHLGQSSS